MTRRGEVRVGCSGWQYKHWRGDFYPTDVPHARWLEHYAATFDTVEINASFYMLPRAHSVDEWKRRTPARFLFAWKASRFLTHMKKLKDPDDALARQFDVADRLGKKLGPVLYQLPPHWGPNLERLDALLAATPKGSRSVIEVREPSWYSPETFAVVAKHRRATICLHDMPGSAIDLALHVGSFVYVRFHGAESKYRGGYGVRALARWAAWLAESARAGLDVFAYFNNDTGGHAPRDAVRLREMIAKRL